MTSGTSMASELIAGISALLWATDCTIDTIDMQLIETGKEPIEPAVVAKDPEGKVPEQGKDYKVRSIVNNKASDA